MVQRLEIRRRIEAREESLSPNAVRSRLSRGRLRSEEPCPIRTAFQRDRDRIIHCKAFRRLKHKTQVFIAPLGDHYVTRLTHTLEVSQLARTIARSLNLNEDLAEAISLGHDLGHTPFGHMGEETLDELFPKGFRHNEQSLRVVDVLENDGRGLNLTWEVRDGILNHSKIRADIFGDYSDKAATFEGQACKIADAIAYINHDIGDAIRAGIISEGDLPLEAVMVIGNSHSVRINNMITDIILNSQSVATGEPKDTEPEIKMSEGMLKASNILREFLFSEVYSKRNEKAENAKNIIRLLYDYFTKNMDELPKEYHYNDDNDGRKVVDYIAGMTDHYATRTALSLGLIKDNEKPW